MNGYRPKGIKLLRRLPEEYELKIPGGRSGRQDFLRDMRDQKLFIVDATAVGKLPSGFARNYAPLLILKLERRNKLVPLFIQSHIKENSFVVTPDDGKYEWKLAKRMFEGFNSMEQTVGEHLLESHLVLEVFAVAAYKSFSYNHPVYKTKD